MVAEPKQIKAIVRGGAAYGLIQKPGIAMAIEEMVERMEVVMRSAVEVEPYGPHLFSVDDCDELEDLRQSLRLLGKTLARKEGRIERWACRECGKTLLEHSVVAGDVYRFCDNHQTKVLNHLRDGIPQM